MKKECVVTTDTKCGCPDNYIYHKFRPCTKCPTNQIIQNNRCINNTLAAPTKPPSASGSPFGSLSVEWQVACIAGSCLLLILLIVLFAYVYLKYRQKKRQLERPVHEGAVEEEIEPLEKKPEKLPERSAENIYSALPLPMTMPTVSYANGNLLDAGSLPHEFFDELSCLLSENYAKNYKNLAAGLGYKYYDIKCFQQRKEPVVALLEDYLTRQHPTKEELIAAIVKIGRFDVANKVVKLLGGK